MVRRSHRARSEPNRWQNESVQGERREEQGQTLPEPKEKDRRTLSKAKVATADSGTESEDLTVLETPRKIRDTPKERGEDRATGRSIGRRGRGRNIREADEAPLATELSPRPSRKTRTPPPTISKKQKGESSPAQSLQPDASKIKAGKKRKRSAITSGGFDGEPLRVRLRKTGPGLYVPLPPSQGGRLGQRGYEDNESGEEGKKKSGKKKKALASKGNQEKESASPPKLSRKQKLKEQKIRKKRQRIALKKLADRVESWGGDRATVVGWKAHFLGRLDSKKVSYYLSPDKQRFTSSIEVLSYLGLLEEAETKARAAAFEGARKRIRWHLASCIRQPSWSLTLSSQKLIIRRLGYIVPLPNFHTEKNLFPVYYESARAVRLDADTTSPEEKIDDAEERGRIVLLCFGVLPAPKEPLAPMFRVKIVEREDQRTLQVITATTPKQAWERSLQSLERLGSLRVDEDLQEAPTVPSNEEDVTHPFLHLLGRQMNIGPADEKEAPTETSESISSTIMSVRLAASEASSAEVAGQELDTSKTADVVEVALADYSVHVLSLAELTSRLIPLSAEAEEREIFTSSALVSLDISPITVPLSAARTVSDGFGFGIPYVNSLLEGLPGATWSQAYVFRAIRLKKQEDEEKKRKRKHSASSQRDKEEEALEKMLRKEEEQAAKAARKRAREEEKEFRKAQKEEEKRKKEEERQEEKRKKEEERLEEKKRKDEEKQARFAEREALRIDRDRLALERRLMMEEERRQKEREKEEKFRERKREAMERKVMADEEKALRKFYRQEERERTLQRRREEAEQARKQRGMDKKSLRSYKARLREEHEMEEARAAALARRRAEWERLLVRGVEESVWNRAKFEALLLVDPLVAADKRLNKLFPISGPTTASTTPALSQEDSHWDSPEPPNAVRCFSSCAAEDQGELLSVLDFSHAFLPSLGFHPATEVTLEEAILPIPPSVASPTLSLSHLILSDPFPDAWTKFSRLAFSLVRAVVPDLWRIRQGESVMEEGTAEADRLRPDFERTKPISALSWPELARQCLKAAVQLEKGTPVERIVDLIWGGTGFQPSRRKSIARSQEEEKEHPIVLMLYHKIHERGKALVEPAVQPGHITEESAKGGKVSEVSQQEGGNALPSTIEQRAKSTSDTGQSHMEIEGVDLTQTGNNKRESVEGNQSVEVGVSQIVEGEVNRATQILEDKAPSERQPSEGAGGILNMGAISAAKEEDNESQSGKALLPHSEQKGLSTPAKEPAKEKTFPTPTLLPSSIAPDTSQLPDGKELKEEKEKSSDKGDSDPRKAPGQIQLVLDLMKRIVRALQAKDYSLPFREPVDSNLYPDYFLKVKKPMDLSSILSKVEDGDYLEDAETAVQKAKKASEEEKDKAGEEDATPQELAKQLISLFRGDISQIWKNCRIYNDSSSQICILADKMEAVANRLQREGLSCFLSPEGELLKEEEEIKRELVNEDICRACKRGENLERMLLCDRCDASFHTYCLTPPLDDIPDGDWFCPDCVEDESFWSKETGFAEEEKAGEEDEEGRGGDKGELDGVRLLREDQKGRMMNAIKLLSREDVTTLIPSERVYVLRALCDMVLYLSGAAQQKLTQADARVEELRSMFPHDGTREVRRGWYEFHAPAKRSSAFPLQGLFQNDPRSPPTAELENKEKNLNGNTDEETEAEAEGKDSEAQVMTQDKFDPGRPVIVQSLREPMIQPILGDVEESKPDKGEAEGKKEGSNAKDEVENGKGRPEAQQQEYKTEEPNRTASGEQSSVPRSGSTSPSVAIGEPASGDMKTPQLSSLSPVRQPPTTSAYDASTAAKDRPNAAVNASEPPSTFQLPPVQEGPSNDEDTGADGSHSLAPVPPQTTAIEKKEHSAVSLENSVAAPPPSSPKRLAAGQGSENVQDILPPPEPMDLEEEKGELSQSNLQRVEKMEVDEASRSTSEGLAPSPSHENLGMAREPQIVTGKITHNSSPSKSEKTSEREPNKTEPMTSIELEKASEEGEKDDDDMSDSLTEYSVSSIDGYSELNFSDEELAEQEETERAEEEAMEHLMNKHVCELLQLLDEEDSLKTRQKETEEGLCKLCGTAAQDLECGFIFAQIPPFFEELLSYSGLPLPREIEAQRRREEEEERRKKEREEEREKKRKAALAAVSSAVPEDIFKLSLAELMQEGAVTDEDLIQVRVYERQVSMILRVTLEGFIQVKDFVTLDDGSQGPVQRDGRVKRGDVLWTIDNQPLGRPPLSLQETITKIRTSDRPIRLGFCPHPSRAEIGERKKQRKVTRPKVEKRAEEEIATPTPLAPPPPQMPERVHWLCVNALIESRRSALAAIKRTLRADEADIKLRASLVRTLPLGTDRLGSQYFKLLTSEHMNCLYVSRKDSGWWCYKGVKQISKLAEQLDGQKCVEEASLITQVALRYELPTSLSSLLRHLKQEALRENPLPPEIYTLRAPGLPVTPVPPSFSADTPAPTLQKLEEEDEKNLRFLLFPPGFKLRAQKVVAKLEAKRKSEELILSLDASKKSKAVAAKETKLDKKTKEKKKEEKRKQLALQVSKGQQLSQPLSPQSAAQTQTFHGLARVIGKVLAHWDECQKELTLARAYTLSASSTSSLQKIYQFLLDRGSGWSLAQMHSVCCCVVAIIYSTQVLKGVTAPELSGELVQRLRLVSRKVVAAIFSLIRQPGTATAKQANECWAALRSLTGKVKSGDNLPATLLSALKKVADAPRSLFFSFPVPLQDDPGTVRPVIVIEETEGQLGKPLVKPRVPKVLKTEGGLPGEVVEKEERMGEGREGTTTKEVVQAPTSQSEMGGTASTSSSVGVGDVGALDPLQSSAALSTSSNAPSSLLDSSGGIDLLASVTAGAMPESSSISLPLADNFSSVPLSFSSTGPTSISTSLSSSLPASQFSMGVPQVSSSFSLGIGSSSVSQTLGGGIDPTNPFSAASQPLSWAALQSQGQQQWPDWSSASPYLLPPGMAGSSLLSNQLAGASLASSSMDPYTSSSLLLSGRNVLSSGSSLPMLGQPSYNAFNPMMDNRLNPFQSLPDVSMPASSMPPSSGSSALPFTPNLAASLLGDTSPFAVTDLQVLKAAAAAAAATGGRGFAAPSMGRYPQTGHPAPPGARHPSAVSPRPPPPGGARSAPRGPPSSSARAAAAPASPFSPSPPRSPAPTQDPARVTVPVKAGSLGLMLEPAGDVGAVLTGFVEGVENSTLIKAAGVTVMSKIMSIAQKDLSNLTLSDIVRVISSSAKMHNRKVVFLLPQNRKEKKGKNVASSSSSSRSSAIPPRGRTLSASSPKSSASQLLTNSFTSPSSTSSPSSSQSKSVRSETPGQGTVGQKKKKLTVDEGTPKKKMKLSEGGERDDGAQLASVPSQSFPSPSKMKKAYPTAVIMKQLLKVVRSMNPQKRKAESAPSGQGKEGEEPALKKKLSEKESTSSASLLPTGPAQEAGRGSSIGTATVSLPALSAHKEIEPKMLSTLPVQVPPRRVGELAETAFRSCGLDASMAPKPTQSLQYLFLASSLFHLEAALPAEAFKEGRWTDGVRMGWTETILSSNSSRILMEMLLVLESVVSRDYLENWWFHSYTSPTSALRQTTFASVALRLQTFDRALQFTRAPPKKRSLAAPSSLSITPGQAAEPKEEKRDAGDYSTLPAEITRIFGEWMMSGDHIKHPFPTQQELQDLARSTGATVLQIERWFQDHRDSVWRPFLISVASDPSLRTKAERGGLVSMLHGKEGKGKKGKKAPPRRPSYQKLVTSYVLPAASSDGTIMDRLLFLLEKLMKNPLAPPFNEPVDPELVPGYHRVIKSPMDLGTIKNKLTSKEYKTYMDVVEDVELVWKNCFKFNKLGSPIYSMAEKLSAIFDRLWVMWISSVEPGTPTSSLVEDDTCVVCRSASDTQNILLCDRCDAHYHTSCLSPPLTAVPEGDWYCPDCTKLKINDGEEGTAAAEPSSAAASSNSAEPGVGEVKAEKKEGDTAEDSVTIDGNIVLPLAVLESLLSMRPSRLWARARSLVKPAATPKKGSGRREKSAGGKVKLDQH